MAARSKARTVFALSNTGIVGSNHSRGIDVCVCVCVVLCVGSGLATVWSLVQESYRPCKKDYETEEETRAQQRAVEPLMNESVACHLRFYLLTLPLTIAGGGKGIPPSRKYVLTTGVGEVSRSSYLRNTLCLVASLFESWDQCHWTES
jgi:hypothetical protein